MYVYKDGVACPISMSLNKMNWDACRNCVCCSSRSEAVGGVNVWVEACGAAGPFDYFVDKRIWRFGGFSFAMKEMRGRGVSCTNESFGVSYWAFPKNGVWADDEGVADSFLVYLRFFDEDCEDLCGLVVDCYCF